MLVLKKQKSSIINIASVSGLLGDYNMAVYSAAKGAVVNLVRSMTLNYGKDGIRVNNVYPGPTNTPMFQKNPASVIESFNQASPLGHVVEPEDIVAMVYFLSSDQASSLRG